MSGSSAFQPRNAEDLAAAAQNLIPGSVAEERSRLRIRRALALIAATLAVALVSPLLSHAESGTLHVYVRDFDHEILLDAVTPSSDTPAGVGTAKIFGYFDAFVADLALTCLRVDKASGVATVRALGIAQEPPTVSPEQGEYDARVFRIEIRNTMGSTRGSFGFQEIDPAMAASGCSDASVQQRTAIDVVYRWDVKI